MFRRSPKPSWCVSSAHTASMPLAVPVHVNAEALTKGAWAAVPVTHVGLDSLLYAHQRLSVNASHDVHLIAWDRCNVVSNCGSEDESDLSVIERVPLFHPTSERCRCSL